MKTLIQITLILLTILGSNAFSHAELTSSAPKNNEQITSAPNKLVLEFNKPVRLLKVELFDQAGKPIALNFKVSSEPKQRFELTINEIKHGDYTVKWVALGGDTHKMSGKFAFHFRPQTKPTDKEPEHQH